MIDRVPALELPKGQPLSPEETRRLLALAQAGDDGARDRLVQANLRLVMMVVRRFAGRGTETDDLFQIGCLGLVRAIDRFDLKQEVRFSTYAVPLIIGEIRRFLRENRPVKVGRTLHDLGQQALRASERLTQELGRVPTPGELAEAVGTSKEEVVAAVDALQPPASLDEVVHQDEGDPLRLGDQVGGPAPPQESMEILVESLALRQALGRLPRWERELLVLRFFQEKTQTEAAALLGVSQAHVSRSERRILRTIRGWLG